MVTTTRMRRTVALGAEFWNDSCDLRELGEAVAAGAVGATSNPLIVAQAVQADGATWLPVLDDLVATYAADDEDTLAWRFVEAIARRAAALLAPAHAASGGRAGILCVQVDPRLYRSSARMVEHGRRLAALAPNVAVKVPATAAGVAAIEALIADGIRINATVSFSLAQAVACAEAVERGLARAPAGVAPGLRAYTTVMVGRLDDHLKRVAERDRVSIEPGWLDWAGIAVFKRVAATFRERGYRATPLAAAYRHHLHWSELTGPGVVLSMPYRWWTQFERSGIEPGSTLEQPVDARIEAGLAAHFVDYRRAATADGLHPDEFAGWGPSVHTLRQFLGGWQQLVDIVRTRMLR
jgi:transaldolase